MTAPDQGVSVAKLTSTGVASSPRPVYGWFSQAQADRYGTLVYTVPDKDYLVECSEVMNYGTSTWPDAVAVGRVGTHVSDVATDAVVRKADLADVCTGWVTEDTFGMHNKCVYERFDRPGQVTVSFVTQLGTSQRVPPDATACGHVGEWVRTHVSHLLPHSRFNLTII